METPAPIARQAVSSIKSCKRNAVLAKKIKEEAKKVAANSWRYKNLYYLCNRKTKETRFTKSSNQDGSLTEWLGSGLQNRVQQFESAGYLKASIVSMFAFFICIVYFCFVLYGFKKLQGELIKLSL